MSNTQQPMPLFDTADGDSWRQRNPHFFRSETSLRWFHRFNKTELVERGAVSLLAGRWMAVEPTMTQAILTIAKRNAEHAIGNEGTAGAEVAADRGAKGAA